MVSGPHVDALLSSTSRMVPTFLRRAQTRHLSLWWDFCYVVWFRVVFSLSWDILFKCFFFRMFDGVRYQDNQVFERLRFSEHFTWFGNSISHVISRFLLFLVSIAHSSISYSIPISSQYILTACFKVSDSFSSLANTLMSTMYVMWLLFTCDLVRFFIHRFFA